MSPGDASIRVEVAYARPDSQAVVAVDLRAGSTVADAIRESGICGRFPEIDLDSQKVGVFGRLVRLEEALRNRDRVEIYRPLVVDPKEMRRQRAREGQR